MNKLFAGFLVSLALSVGARADLLIGWDVAGLTGGEPNVAPTYVAPNLATNTILVRGSGLTTTLAANAFIAGSWTMPANVSTVNDAINSNDYFSFTITADSGYTLDLTNVNMRVSRSNTGASNLTLRSSADGFASDLGAWTFTGTPNLSATINITGETSVEFRLYGYGASAAGGTTRIADGANFGATGIDLAVFGTVVPEPGTLMLMAGGFGILAAVRRRLSRR